MLDEVRRQAISPRSPVIRVISVITDKYGEAGGCIKPDHFNGDTGMRLDGLGVSLHLLQTSAAANAEFHHRDTVAALRTGK